MFTGITTHLGKVSKVSAKGGQVLFRFQFSKPEKDICIGESIAVSGVCLTVTKAGKSFFEAIAVKDTLDATHLGGLSEGDFVNLERSLKLGDRMGGHYVTGHVDAMGKILGIKKLKKNWVFEIQVPAKLSAFIAPKGSVTCDGVSLTIQRTKKKSFEVAIIPHTYEVTTFGSKKIGSPINIEIDLMMRYLENYLKKSEKSKKSKKITLSHLVKEGF